MTSDIGMMKLGVVPVARETSPVTPSNSKTDAKEKAKEVDSTAAADKAQDAEQLQDVVDGLNGLVQDLKRDLEFSVDHGSGEMVIKVIDRETDEVVRQLPPEEVLKLRKRLLEAAGVMFTGQA